MGRKHPRLVVPVLWPVAGSLAVVALLSTSLRSLPSYRSLYQAKSGYPVNCEVCHSSGDARLTSYAREFVRLGRNRDALNALDLMDPDQDNVSSGAEIKAKSNPGDPRSTPDHPGSWLAAIKPTPPPHNIFNELFGRRRWTSTVLEKELGYEATNKVERIIKVPLYDEDLFPTVFHVWEKTAPPESGRLLGRARYVTYSRSLSGLLPEGLGRPGPSIFLVVMSSSDTLRAVRGITVTGDQRLMRMDYLKQFVGKTYAELQAVESPVGIEAENAALLAAVKRGMVVIEAATDPTR